MVKISRFGEDFLLLALRIDKHINGYVDYYYGPEKFRALVKKETITSPKQLLKDSITLKQQLELQGYTKKRQNYLYNLLIAMKTSIESLIGT